MLKNILFIFACVLNAFIIQGQSLQAYAGMGISGDIFLRDASITKYKSAIPFEVSPQSVFGLQYNTNQNFDIFLEASLGLARLKLPNPSNYNIDYTQIQSYLMLGTGYHIPTPGGGAIMPFIQLGAGFFDFWSLTTHNINFTINNNVDYNTNRWTAVCGAGINWQFKLLVPSAVNFRFTLTPVNLFADPVRYTIPSNNGGTEDVFVQGKMLQAMLTYKVYFPIRK